MLLINILIIAFVCLLVILAFKKRAKAYRENQPVYDENGNFIGHIDKNMKFRTIHKTRKNSGVEFDSNYDCGYDSLGLGCVDTFHTDNINHR